MIQRKERKNTFWYLFIFSSSLIATTIIGLLFRTIGFPETNIVLLYILSVLLISRFTYGYIYGLIGSIFATGAFNYFFTEPYYTLSVYDSSYLITFTIMMATAFITSTLTSKIIRNAEIAKEKEADTNSLYRLSSRLTDAKETPAISSIVVETVSDVFKCKAAFLTFTYSQEPELIFIQQQSKNKQIRRKVLDIETLKYQIVELRTTYNEGEEFYDWPIYGRDTILGLIRIPKAVARKMDGSQEKVLHSMIETTSLAMDRVRSVEESQKLKEEATQERYRGNLLRAISHDFRTPLSSIMGTSEMIIGVSKPDEEVYTMAKNIYNDAEWLHALVENILALTRLHEGKIVLTKQSEAVEEVIGAAVKAITSHCNNCDIIVHIPNEVLLVPMDAKLIEQVLINILDNAIKHSQATDEICISVQENLKEQRTEFSVTDRGKGIKPEDLPYIFQMFFTSHTGEKDKRRGIGLGLSICDSIVKAHGGLIKARNRADGPGAEILFTLPLQ